MSVLKVFTDKGVWEQVGSIPSDHTHTKDDIIDFPSSLPANGGNADTLDGKYANEFALTSEIPTKVSQLENDSKYLTSVPSEYITESELNAKKYLTNYTETDPTVPSWAKEPNKPTYTKSEVGLGNVDNTSDTNKPVSTAQATAIADAKKAGTDAQSNLTTHTNNKSNPHGVTKAQVGLSNVENVKQYSASNPPPYPVTSVNGMTGAVTLNSIFYIEGNSETAGTWTGSHDDITTYFNGLTIAYKTNIAGVSGGSTLNINGLGAAPVHRNASTAVTTIYPVGSVIILTYSDGAWLTADYDANSKNTAGTSNKADTKMYLVGAASQTSSGTTTYTNKNVYISTDNCLYSNGAKVLTSTDKDEIASYVISTLSTWTGGSY